MDKKYWYAAQIDSDDTWDNGSYDLNAAIEMAKALRAEGYDDALVAVIDKDDSFCVREIRDLND